MHDQANDLRRLVRQSAPQEIPTRGRGPHLVVVTSGKGGVGTTTIAVNLAVAMARGGLKTVLVDADPLGGDVATLCRLEERYTLADVLAARRTAAEVLQPGPGSVEILPGLWGLERLSESLSAAGKHLLDELEGIGGQTGLVILDAGNRPNRMTRRFWQAADLILVVTSCETPSILDTYSAIKALAETSTAVPIHLLVNLAPTARAAEEVQRRLDQACRRFLGIRLTDASHVPVDPQVAEAAAVGQPFVIACPGCHAARHVLRLGKTLAASIATPKTYKTPFRGGGPISMDNHTRPPMAVKN